MESLEQAEQLDERQFRYPWWSDKRAVSNKPREDTFERIFQIGDIPQEKLEIKRNLTKPWAKRTACLETTFPNPNKKQSYPKTRTKKDEKK